MRRALTTLLVAAVVAGCGGEADDRLSREEWVRQADAICKRVNDRLEQTEQPETMAQLVTVLEQGLTDVNRAVRQLRELEPPKDIEEDVDVWLGRVEAAAAEIREARDAAKTGDEEALADALAEGTRINEKGNEQARELGLKECAEE